MILQLKPFYNEHPACFACHLLDEIKHVHYTLVLHLARGSQCCFQTLLDEAEASVITFLFSAVTQIHRVPPVMHLSSRA